MPALAARLDFAVYASERMVLGEGARVRRAQSVSPRRREGTTSAAPPIGAFFIDEVASTQWLTGSTEDVCANVSRRDAELGLAPLLDGLAQNSCGDRA